MNGSYNDFIISRSNMKAAAKCFAVASGTDKCRILFVQGPASSGKTHLMHSVAAVFAEQKKTDAIVVSQRQITDDYIQAIKDKNTVNFYNKYSTELLLVDDVQELANRTATQSEFINIFRKLSEDGACIILFSEYELNRYDEFKAGFSNCSSFDVVDIHKADFVLRKKVLKKALQKENIKIPGSFYLKILLNKKIEPASIKGCVAKIKLIKTLKGDMPDKKETEKILKEYGN